MGEDWRNLPPIPEDEQPEIPERLRVTWLETFDRCDRAAMLSLKYGGGAGSHAMNRGALWHEVAARLMRTAISSGEQRIVPEMAKDELLAYMDEHPELQVSAKERDDLRAMLYNFAEGSWFGLPILAVETGVRLELGGFTISGRVDLAEDLGGGVLQVSDYKTSLSIPDSDEWTAQSFDEQGNPRFAGSFQTQLYALMLAYGTLEDGMPLGEGFDRFKLRLVFPRYLRPEGLLSREVTVTSQQLLDFRFDVEHQLRRLREVCMGERKWAATPGSHCTMCPAEYECPLPPLLRSESQLASCESVEDLERLGASWKFQSDRAATLKRRVKKAAERIGDANPDALDLGEDGRGIRIGKDLALLFLPVEREEVRDKEKLRADLERTVQYGEPFDWAKNYKYREGVEFAKRKVAPR